METIAAAYRDAATALPPPARRGDLRAGGVQSRQMIVLSSIAACSWPLPGTFRYGESD
jgi:hypothetical protein